MSKLKKALEKARAAREGAAGISPPDRSPEGPDGTPPVPRAKQHGPKPDRRGEIDIQYSQTRVATVDRKVLRRNRIISLFPERKTAEQIKKLRTQILSMFQELDGNTLLVTSPNPGEGKTFTCINLGVSIAQEFDRTVLLVDGDLKKPHPRHRDFAADFFGVKVEKGLSDYLQKRAELPELLINPGIEKLTFLPAGKPLVNSAELLGSPRMEALMADIRERYRPERFIIVDTPALLEWTDAVVLSRFVDGILLVVEQEKTAEANLTSCVNLLKGKPIVGAILNKSRV
jgi:non-specific protein-tyrosine kinase